MEPTGSVSPRAAGRNRACPSWCPRCRTVDVMEDVCARCPPGEERAHLVRLVRGLGSIDLAGERGLVHYRGELATQLVGVGLLAMIPCAALFALVWESTAIVSTLLCVSFIGLPALAFVDAGRAGRQESVAPEHMPACAPSLPERFAGRDPGEERPAGGREPGIGLCGQATSLGQSLGSPVSGTPCLMFRLDVRAGKTPELLARYTAAGEFAVTCADGSQTVITGVVELGAGTYQTVQPSHGVRFSVHGTDLLPALFTQGGWACEIALRHGDRVEVRGRPGTARRVHPLGAGYRQSGVLEVLEGTREHPVVVALLRPAS